MQSLRLKLFSLIGLVLSMLFAPMVAHAQDFFNNTRASKVEFYRTTVGTTTALAIPAASVKPNLLGYKICNDAVNTSTYLLLGEATDVSDDGIMLGLGACHVCANCSPSSLKALRVEGQAASNGYSVVQYQQ